MEALNRKDLALNPEDLDAIIELALEIVRAGEWHEDYAHMMATQAWTFHGDEGLERFNQAVGDALDELPKL